MRHQVLIVQADHDALASMRAWLEAEGHDVVEAEDLAAARAALGGAPPDAILFEWSSTKELRTLIDGLGKRNGRGGSCVLVTAQESQIAAAVAALELGVDDCIRMPPERAELVARLNASLRRRFGREPERLVAGPLVLDKSVHCLCINDEPVNLAPTEFRLLAFLLEHKGRVFSREEILRRAWTRNIHAGSRTVDVHVRRLRQVLEAHGCASMIQTVRSFGYRFVEKARSESA